MRSSSKHLNTHTCTRTCMATKTITIMDDAYTLLARNKTKDESFSEVIRRVLSQKRSITEFAGAWSDMSEAEENELKENIRKIRKGIHKNLMRRISSYESS